MCPQPRCECSGEGRTSISGPVKGRKLLEVPWEAQPRTLRGQAWNIKRKQESNGVVQEGGGEVLRHFKGAAGLNVRSTGLEMIH